MASREELLASIQPDMHLTRDFIKRIYGYEISYPGFAEQAIAALEQAGCSRARQYYEDWVAEYEVAYNAEMKEVAHWYRLELEKRWEKRRKEGDCAKWEKNYSANSARNSCLQRQRKKLMELKQKLQALN